MRLLIKFAALLAALPMPVSAADAPATIEIGLSSFKYTPDIITLRHGQPYVLRFRNSGSGGHDFVAKAFFAAADVAAADRAKVGAKGSVEVDGGETVDLHLAAPAAPGRYEVHCSHFMHSAFGMKAAIVVD